VLRDPKAAFARARELRTALERLLSWEAAVAALIRELPGAA